MHGCNGKMGQVITGIVNEDADTVMKFISIEGSNSEKIKALRDFNIEDDAYLEGIDEIEKVFEYLKLFNIPEKNTEFDLSIARGLDYYTGTVYETKLNDHPEIGSICSGGRYDDLASYYIKNKLPGVGISIGLTRLFFQLKDAGILKDEDNSLSDCLIIPFEGFMEEAINLTNILRKGGVDAFIYTEEGAKLGKKMKYADNLSIPYTVLIGEDEKKSQKYMLKNMETGNQESLDSQGIIEFIKSNK